MCVVESQTLAARPRLDADLTLDVLVDKSCKIAVMQHRCVTAGADQKSMDGRDGTDGAVVDCGDVDLLITWGKAEARGLRGTPLQPCRKLIDKINAAQSSLCATHDFSSIIDFNFFASGSRREIGSGARELSHFQNVHVAGFLERAGDGGLERSSRFPNRFEKSLRRVLF
jgi:hypothetical protein